MKKIAFVVLGLGYLAALSTATEGQTPSPGDGPQYVDKVQLVRPADYREWIFVSSGLGMEYNPMPGTPGGNSFGNVFVNPSSYRAFMKTGKWPDRTIFVLEFRRMGVLQLHAERSDGGARSAAAGEHGLRRVPHHEHGSRTNVRPVLPDATGRRPEDGHRKTGVLGRNSRNIARLS
jgi:hypothetical protein